MPCLGCGDDARPARRRRLSSKERCSRGILSILQRARPRVASWVWSFSPRSLSDPSVDVRFSQGDRIEIGLRLATGRTLSTTNDYQWPMFLATSPPRTRNWLRLVQIASCAFFCARAADYGLAAEAPFQGTPLLLVDELVSCFWSRRECLAMLEDQESEKRQKWQGMPSRLTRDIRGPRWERASGPCLQRRQRRASEKASRPAGTLGRRPTPSAMNSALHLAAGGHAIARFSPWLARSVPADSSLASGEILLASPCFVPQAVSPGYPPILAAEAPLR